MTNVEPGPFRTDWAGRSASYLETKIDDYSDTVGTALDWIKGASGNQAGDPYKAGQAIYEITTVENPPLLLPLGESAFTEAQRYFKAALKSLEEFEHVGRPTDFVEEKPML